MSYGINHSNCCFLMTEDNYAVLGDTACVLNRYELVFSYGTDAPA